MTVTLNMLTESLGWYLELFQTRSMSLYWLIPFDTAVMRDKTRHAKLSNILTLTWTVTSSVTLGSTTFGVPRYIFHSSQIGSKIDTWVSEISPIRDMRRHVVLSVPQPWICPRATSGKTVCRQNRLAQLDRVSWCKKIASLSWILVFWEWIKRQYVETIPLWGKLNILQYFRIVSPQCIMTAYCVHKYMWNDEGKWHLRYWNHYFHQSSVSFLL